MGCSKKATVKKAAKPSTKQTRKPESLAQRKKISAALIAYYAKCGGCKTPRRSHARSRSAAWYRTHGYHKVGICTAVTDGYTRSMIVQVRNTAKLRRGLWAQIRHAQHLSRRAESAYLIHMGWRAQSVGLHGAKAAAAKKKARPRNLHASRVSCHTAWRRTASTNKPRLSVPCPKSKHKSRLTGKP